MDNYLLFFLIFLILDWIISVIISKNLISPSSIFAFVFLLSTICAYYSKDLWDFSLSGKTCFVLISGILIFQLTSIFIKLLYKKRGLLNKNIDFEEIKINSGKAFILLFIFLILSFIYITSIAKVANTYNIFKMGSIYRVMSTTNNVQISFLARLCLTIIRTISTVLICVIFNNLFAKKFKENHGILLLICVILYILLTIFSGERTSLLRIATISVLAFNIFWLRKNKYKNFYSLKYMIIGLIGIFALLYIFSAVRFFVGRSSQLNLLDYISLYAGGPIYNFNRFIATFTEATMNGRSTFIALFNNLARLGFGNLQSIHREVVVIESKKIYLGNVYTCFYDYYKDFNFLGMIVLIFVYSCIMNVLYNKCKCIKNKTFTRVVLYVFFGSTLFFTSFTEQFYSSFISISTIESLIIIYFTILFISSKRIDSLRYSVKLL